MTLRSSRQLDGSNSPTLGLGVCRYRCLVALQHNLPASGDMCVSVLSRLCTVTPNMYCVGVSKVSPTHAQPLGALWLETVGSEVLRQEATQPSWGMDADPTSRLCLAALTVRFTILPSPPLQTWPSSARSRADLSSVSRDSWGGRAQAVPGGSQPQHSPAAPSSS